MNYDKELRDALYKESQDKISAYKPESFSCPCCRGEANTSLFNRDPYGYPHLVYTAWCTECNWRLKECRYSEDIKFFAVMDRIKSLSGGTALWMRACSPFGPMAPECPHSYQQEPLVGIHVSVEGLSNPREDKV